MNLIYDLDNTDKIDIILDRIGEANCVLLGEASHGTSEFYLWRAEISKRLISEKGFSFIAVEGDWPDCYKVNQYIKDNPESYSTASQVLFSFNRWPTWMWANKEMIELVEWLKDYNKLLTDGTKVGFYGLDLYSLWESMEEIIRYVKRVDPTLLRNAIRAYNCFEPYNKEVEAYARATAFVPKNCEQEVIELLVALRNKYSLAINEKSVNTEDYFNVEQNAITVVDAENYYRTMIKGDVNSWNLRDTHMTNTLQRLLNYYGNQSRVQNPKAIIWAHNTHVGDARFTDMSLSGMTNIGQMMRERNGIHNTVLVGFSTYEGTVIAAEEWGAKMEKINVPAAREGSWDYMLHHEYDDSKKNIKNRLLVFERNDVVNTILDSKKDDFLYDESFENRGQRAIGVVYNPKYERFGNYVPTVLPLRYDLLLFIDSTNALYPLHIKQVKDKDLPDTFPRGE